MWLKKVFLIFATLFYRFSLVGGCYDGERAALMSFKSLLTDPSNRLSSWKGENCCSWKGIKCSSSGRVVVVNLRNPHPDEVMINVNKEVVSNSNNTSEFSLKGTVYPLLFTLDHIQYLDLSFNNFVFTKLPVEISNLTKLTYLNLSNAMFQDSISTQFSNLTSLRSLDPSCANLVPDLSSVSVSLTLQPKLDVGSFLSFISNGYLSSPNLRWLEGLRHLRYLVMTGRIPIGQLLNFTSLSVLDTSSNILTSTIPDMLSNLTTLSALDFSVNDLDGHIPYLPQLEQLYVSSNPAMTINLVSMFSASWSKLKFLDISFSHVGGTLPPSLSNSTSLTFFQADGCSIQGSIPSSVTKLKKLRILVLNDNNITGQLPVSMSSLISLQYLSLIQNGLRGYIPTSICQILSLDYLNVQWNELTGSVPSCILQLPKLSYLSVQNNNLNGNMPLSLIQKSKLGMLVSGKRCSASTHSANFPAHAFGIYILQNERRNPRVLFKSDEPRDFTFGEQQSIRRHTILDVQSTSPICSEAQSRGLEKVVDFIRQSCSAQLIEKDIPGLHGLGCSSRPGPILDHDKLGSIPTQIGEIPEIWSISLFRNKIHGPVPESFCQSTNVLQVLDLSNNSLYGTIPRSLGNCKSLIYLNLGQNKLTGSVSKKLELITSLCYLDLNGDQFEGSFPVVLEKFQEMEILKLAGNRFEGRMTKFIGDLHHLRILVLASNSFNESIPEGVMKLENLQFISLSRNKLSGPILENLEGLKKMKKTQNQMTILGYYYSLKFTGA
ncbi:hypothetical protein BC332_14183 [Capsicum chinense]|nr:hypothetical protein BC332_14183 [Capsicum chinense]